MKYFFVLLFFVSIPAFFHGASLPDGPTRYDIGFDGSKENSAFLNRKSEGGFPITAGNAFPKGRQYGFFKRIALVFKAQKALLLKKWKYEETNPADKKAKTSLWIGIIALVCAIVPWYTIFAAIPLGIVAINMGIQAKRMGAKTMNGKGFGIAALGLVAIWILLTVLIIAAFAITWGGIFAG